MIRKAEYKGEKHSLFEWAKILGMSYHTLTKRYNRGERGEELFRVQRIVQCKICGKEFTTVLNRKKCCSEECVKKNSKINQEIWWNKQKGIKPKKKEKKLTVTQIAVMAKQAGMTYGQYVARMEGRW